MTGVKLFIDNFANRKTIKIMDQEAYIVKDIKEHFNIDYDINKVSFVAGFPDGYYLDLYDYYGNVKKVFEDRHEDSDIFRYFQYVETDKSKYENYLHIEISIEILVLIVWNFITLYKNERRAVNSSK